MDDQKQSTNPSQSSNSILQGSIDLTTSPAPQTSLPHPDGEDFLPEHASNPPSATTDNQPASILFERETVPPTFIDSPPPPQKLDTDPPESILNPQTSGQTVLPSEETASEPLDMFPSDPSLSSPEPAATDPSTRPPQFEAPNQPSSPSTTADSQPLTPTSETTPSEPQETHPLETTTPSPTSPPLANNHVLLVILAILVGLILVIAAIFAYQFLSGENSAPESNSPDQPQPQESLQPTSSPTQTWTLFEGETSYTQDGSSRFSIKYPPDWEREGNVLYPYGKTASTMIALGGAGHGISVSPTDKSFPAGTARYYWDSNLQDDFAFASFTLGKNSYIFEAQNIPASKSAELKEQFDLMLSTFRPMTPVEESPAPSGTSSSIPSDWVKHTLKSQGLSLYFPKGWQANAINNLDTNIATVNFYQTSPQNAPMNLVIQPNWDNTQNAQSTPINYRVGKEPISAILLTNVKAATDSSQLVNKVYFEQKDKVLIFTCLPEVASLCDQVLQTVEF